MGRLQELETQHRELIEERKRFLQRHSAFDKRRVELVNAQKKLADEKKLLDIQVQQIQALTLTIKQQEEKQTNTEAEEKNEEYLDNKNKLQKLTADHKKLSAEIRLSLDKIDRQTNILQAAPESKEFLQYGQKLGALKKEIDHIKKNGDTPFQPTPVAAATTTNTGEVKTAGVLENKDKKGRGMTPVNHLDLIEKDENWQAAFCEAHGYTVQRKSSKIEFQSTTTADAKITVHQDYINTSVPKETKDQDKVARDTIILYLKTCLPKELYGHCIYGGGDVAMKEKLENELAKQLRALGVNEFRINGKKQDQFLNQESHLSQEVTITRTPTAPELENISHHRPSM